MHTIVRGGMIVGALALLGVVTPATAQQKTFTLGGYGGSFEQTMRKDVIPAFEAKHGVKVEYVAGNSTDTLAKLSHPPYQGAFAILEPGLGAAAFAPGCGPGCC